MIILDPGEVFEHCHATASGTRLRRGRVRFRCGETEAELRPGDTLTVPGLVPHELENIGAVRACIDCFHEPPHGP